MQKKILIGSDHAGYSLKDQIIRSFKNNTIELIDFGCFDENSVHYPHIAHKLCQSITENLEQEGILICGTGIGMSIVANRYQSIRAAVVLNTEMAQLARNHNNANILCLGARLIDESTALAIINIWINSEFQKGRHEERIKLI